MNITGHRSGARVLPAPIYMLIGGQVLQIQGMGHAQVVRNVNSVRRHLIAESAVLVKVVPHTIGRDSDPGHRPKPGMRDGIKCCQPQMRMKISVTKEAQFSSGRQDFLKKSLFTQFFLNQPVTPCHLSPVPHLSPRA
jgi:hypothetical protein